MRPVFVLCLLSTLLLGACASMPGATGTTATTTIADGRRILAPYKFESGCETDVLVCGARAAAPEKPRMVSAKDVEGKSGLALLKVVNARVNGGIRPTADPTAFGAPDGWNRPSVTKLGYVGDCKNFAVEKRAALVAAGFDPNDLAYAVVYRRDIGLHALLVARVEGVDYVLDNRSPYVLQWRDAPYVWVKRQSPTSATGWRQVLDPGLSKEPTLQLALLDQ